MDQFIDRIGSQISTWLWFARSSRMGSDDLVSDLLQDIGSDPDSGDGEQAGTTAR